MYMNCQVLGRDDNSLDEIELKEKNEWLCDRRLN